jgi:prevent-host-death family protein
MRTWQLQEARNRFSEVVNEALHQGPQVITRRGAETAVVLSIQDYRGMRRPETDLVDFFQASPLAEVELDLERGRDTGREIEL